jgi:hypothetical protein
MTLGGSDQTTVSADTWLYINIFQLKVSDGPNTVNRRAPFGLQFTCFNPGVYPYISDLVL